VLTAYGGYGLHEAGRRDNKKNVFDDSSAASQYLLAQAAALAQVGVMDMMRFTPMTAWCRGTPLNMMLHFRRRTLAPSRT
jgi:prolyl oligopeptidase PreP (S9A serine peptidase family)